MQELRTHLHSLRPTISEILAVSGSPGLSLGVIHQGHIVSTEHFGRRDASNHAPPDDGTIYHVVSLTKALAACAVAILVEDGILDWDGPIREYLPAFRQRKDAIGLNATLIDLLSNRTGLPPATAMWGQQYGEFLLPRTEIVRIACHLEPVKPLRQSFVYSQWNWALVQEVVEAVTGRSLGTFMKERLFDSLNMHRTTLGPLKSSYGVNVASPHAVSNDGVPHHISFPNVDDATGMAGSAGGKSSIRDLLLMYQSLLYAYREQLTTGLTSTPGSPLAQLKKILSPHIGVGSSHIDDMAYCLGLYRTRLPGNLSVASMNNLLLGPKNMPSVGASSPGVDIYHHTGNMPGFFASVFLIPTSQSAVVVLANSLPLIDPTDLVGQLIVALVLGDEPPANLVQIAQAVRAASISSYSRLEARLAKKKTTRRPTFPFAVYEGDYFNALGNFVLSITAREDGLHMAVQASQRTGYDLLPYDGDTFYWRADREEDICEKGMWPSLSASYHKIRFGTSDGKMVDSLTWHHDPLSKPEVFRKGTNPHKLERSNL